MNSTIGKVSAVLEAMARRGQPASLGELAEVLSMPKPTLHRLLLQLKEAGMVAQDPGDRRYRLGKRLVTLAAAVLDEMAVRRAGHDLIYRIAADIGESTYLAVLDWPNVIYIDMAEIERSVRILTTIGSRRPATAVATGHLLVAYRPEADRRQYLQDLLAHAGHLPAIDPVAFAKRLHLIKEQGYALLRDQPEMGAASCAAPVFDAAGECVAALAIVMPTSRLDDRSQAALVQAATTGAAELSERLAKSSERPSTRRRSLVQSGG